MTQVEKKPLLKVVQEFNRRNKKGILRLRVRESTRNLDFVVETYVDMRKDSFLEPAPLNFSQRFHSEVEEIAAEFGLVAHTNNTWSTWWFTKKERRF